MLDPENPGAYRLTPYFLVPSDVPTSSTLDDPAATGWTIRFTKVRTGLFAYARVGGCDETALGNGLVHYPPRARGQAAAGVCPQVSLADLYLPEESDPLLAHVRITCAVETRVPNCQMVDRMPNGWQAEISLPKTQLDRWRDASADARAFFTAHLTDCGV